MNKTRQAKFRVKPGHGDRHFLQRRIVWDRWKNISSHSTEELAYRAMRKAERKEMTV